jgi:hypothetical protein
MDEVKKGKPTWRPARRLDVNDKDPNFSYRWLDSRDPGNIEKKQAEGWQVVSKLTSDKSVPADGTTAPTTLLGVRELTLGRMPKEMAEARNAYFQKDTAERTKALGGKLRSDLNNRGGATAESYGKIVIE